MSQAITKHRWQLLGVVVIVAAIVAAIWYSNQGVQPAAAQGGGDPPVIDVATWYGVEHLRGELQLRTGDMASLGLTQAQSEAVLAALLQWQQTNGASLATARQTLRSAARQLREAMQRVHVGPSPSRLLNDPEATGVVTQAQIDQTMTQLPSLIQARQNAETAYGNLIGQARTAAGAGMTSEQRTLWDLAEANHGVPARYRHVSSLTTDQAAQLTARGGGIENEEQVLSFTQQQAVEATIIRSVGHFSQVQSAEEAVLPMPAEVLAERELDPIEPPAGGS
ncbi:MAG: hypothetical protein MI741_03820 [Rhodospirillales bacterium]|nr:hypothetical protein [Rhodospirillales bacterium]